MDRLTGSEVLQSTTVRFCSKKKMVEKRKDFMCTGQKLNIKLKQLTMVTKHKGYQSTGINIVGLNGVPLCTTLYGISLYFTYSCKTSLYE